MAEPQVLRADDPRVPALLADGWTVRHRSWGARLRRADAEALRQLTAVAGYRVSEADPSAEPGIAALEAAVRVDYPGGPATAPGAHDAAGLAALRQGGTRFFAARRRRGAARSSR